jgi:hypothetical protein
MAGNRFGRLRGASRRRLGAMNRALVRRLLGWFFGMCRKREYRQCGYQWKDDDAGSAECVHVRIPPLLSCRGARAHDPCPRSPTPSALLLIGLAQFVPLQISKIEPICVTAWAAAAILAV